MTRILMPCGTNAAAARHIRRGEDPCAPCMDAKRTEAAERSKPYANTRQRAFERLRRAHPRDWNRILADERARVLEEDYPETSDERERTRGKSRQRAFAQLAIDFRSEYEALLREERIKEGLIAEAVGAAS